MQAVDLSSARAVASSVQPVVSHYAPGQRNLNAIMQDLSRPVPSRFIETKTVGGTPLRFISWHTAQRILDAYAPGWSGEVVKIHTTDERVFVVYRVSIPTCDGVVSREATGTEYLDRNTFGDPTSNAEAQAFKRACARFGLALHLYRDE